MWPFSSKTPSGFTWYSTADEVTRGVDGSGLTAIVTGASSGIGVETTRVLATHGVHVVMAVRNLSSGDSVKEAILKENPSAKVDIMELDLASLASVKKFASEYISCKLPLNMLINNAGVMATPFMLTRDGIELQFGTNHVVIHGRILKNMLQLSFWLFWHQFIHKISFGCIHAPLKSCMVLDNHSFAKHFINTCKGFV